MQGEEHYCIFVENKIICLDMDSLRLMYLSGESSRVSSSKQNGIILSLV